MIGYNLVLQSHNIALTCHVVWIEIKKKKKTKKNKGFYTNMTDGKILYKSNNSRDRLIGASTSINVVARIQEQQIKNLMKEYWGTEVARRIYIAHSD
jgi:hypothetical protein